MVSEKVRRIRAGSRRLDDWKYRLFVMSSVWDPATFLQNELVFEHEISKSFHMHHLVECLFLTIPLGMILFPFYKWWNWGLKSMVGEGKSLDQIPFIWPPNISVCLFQKPGQFTEEKVHLLTFPNIWTSRQDWATCPTPSSFYKEGSDWRAKTWVHFYLFR